MEYFEMGEKVVVKATMNPMFAGGERKWLREQLVHPKKGFYVGYTYKQEGTLFQDGCFNTHLKDIKSIKVLRIKFSDWGNDKFALLQDVKRIGQMSDLQLNVSAHHKNIARSMEDERMTITERTLKKWRREALGDYNDCVHCPEGNYDSSVVKELSNRILRMTQELLDQHLLRKEVR